MHLKSFDCMEQTSLRNGLSEEGLLNALFNGVALQSLPTPLRCAPLLLGYESRSKTTEKKKARAYLTQMTSTHFSKCVSILQWTRSDQINIHHI